MRHKVHTEQRLLASDPLHWRVSPSSHALGAREEDGPERQPTRGTAVRPTAYRPGRFIAYEGQSGHFFSAESRPTVSLGADLSCGQAGDLRTSSGRRWAAGCSMTHNSVETYLGSPPATEDPISAGQYFIRLTSSDIDAPGNRAIRTRGEEMAANGPTAVANAARASYEGLSVRLPGENPMRHPESLVTL
jgi:hypothetical protein